ncbi:NAD(P)-dependent oxidoreductase [Aquiflexum sp.]|uniref:NAD(P)-dependent oxidoreductase n=1 Tax=Aquiflexum sp. TaxID=1872584 RepID=UPI0035940F75
MHPTKKILLLGATGRTGNEVLHLALRQGYQVNILVRDRSKVNYDHINLQVFEGDTRIQADLCQAISGCDACISCLNISRKSDFPWAALRTPRDFLSVTMNNLIKTYKENDIKRLVFTSAWGVGDSRPYIPGWFVWFIDNSNLSPAYLEHERQEAMVRNSGLDWTIVRPVVLTNRQTFKTPKAILNFEQKPGLTISRKETAQFILAALEDEKYVHKAPVIYS